MIEGEFTPEEVARRVGVERRRVNYWREKGLVFPERRTAGRHGRYTESQVIRGFLAESLLRQVGARRARKLIDDLHRSVEAYLETSAIGPNGWEAERPG